jgi:hypothetical protein
LRHRIELQRQPMARIAEAFGDRVVGNVPEFERDITGLDMIAKVAEQLFGGAQ